jgi:hypothetical protein
MTHMPDADRFRFTDPQNPFEIIDTPWGPLEAWRASTMATGTMGALQNVYDIVRADSAEAAARADAEHARVALLKDVHKKLDALASRVDAVTSELEAIKAKQRADEARQAEFEEEIELPPDFDRPQDLPPSKIGADDTHHPTGDFHALEPSEDLEPDLEIEDAEGDLPAELAPPSEPPPEAKGHVFPPPTALFGN